MWVEIIISDFDSLCWGESALSGCFPLIYPAFPLVVHAFYGGTVQYEERFLRCGMPIYRLEAYVL